MMPACVWLRNPNSQRHCCVSSASILRSLPLCQTCIILSSTSNTVTHLFLTLHLHTHLDTLVYQRPKYDRSRVQSRFWRRLHHRNWSARDNVKGGDELLTDVVDVRGGPQGRRRKVRGRVSRPQASTVKKTVLIVSIIASVSGFN